MCVVITVVVESAEKKVFFHSLQEYLKSRLNCLLVRENLEETDFSPMVKSTASKRKLPVEESKPETKTKLVKTNSEVTDAEWESLTA